MNGMWRSHLSLHGLHTLAVVSISTSHQLGGRGWPRTGDGANYGPGSSLQLYQAGCCLENYKYKDTVILYIHVDIMYYLLNNVVHN